MTHIAEGALLALCALIVTAFVGLIPIGQWYDEYFTIPSLNAGGWPVFKDRLLHWSPRPVSEALVWGYARAVEVAGRPLVTPALGLCWTALAAAVLWPVQIAHRGLTVAAVLGCLFLLGHDVSEVFYWPIAAFAYMLTLAGIVLVLTLDWSGVAATETGRALTIVALTVAALSSEVGAMATAAYCVLLVPIAFAARDRRAAWLLVPATCAAAVFYLGAHGRGANGQEVFGNPMIAHHPLAALLAATMSFAKEVVGPGTADPTVRNIAVSVLSKVGLFLGVYLVAPVDVERSVSRQWQRVAFALALIGAAFFTLAAAYLQFGTACCQRHGTMRQEYVLMAIAALATALAAWRRPAGLRTIGVLFLAVAILLPLSRSAPGIGADYARFYQFVAVRSRLWEAGRRPGPMLDVPQVAAGQIVGGSPAQPGVYGAEGSGYANRVVKFFGKQEGTFLPFQVH